MSFIIDATDLCWIDGSKDNPEDLCLHGHAIVHIANVKLEYDATISSTALYLLKSLSEEHLVGQDNQMLPCCGHFLIANKELNNVVVLGCPKGIDWAIRHKGDTIEIELEDGTKDQIPFEEYKAEVFRFADLVEAFYNACSPKVLPNDMFEKNGYIAFWNEWHTRRNS